MSKLYRKKTGFVVLSGKVVSMSSNGSDRHVVVEYNEFDAKNKTYQVKQITAMSATVDSGVAVGAFVTAFGYPNGQSSIAAQAITANPSVSCVDDFEIVSGMVEKAVYRSETDDYGNPKLKADGTPRKPHFDVTIKVDDEAGHHVNHTVKIYNYKSTAEGEMTEIEKAKRRFEKFEGKEETPWYATIVTSVGQLSSWENEFNGRVYTNFGSSHLGKQSWDFNPICVVDEREKEESRVKMPAPSQQQPTSSSMSAPVVEDEDVFC